MPTIGIVWYTNAGKSSLLNALTNKGVLAENKLFATLGTNVGKCYLITNPETWLGKEVLLNDTIGFIRDLPPKLVKSFSSTLEDSIESDFLLHVDERIDVVHKVLSDIWAHQDKVLVFNKIDKTDEERIVQLREKYSDFNCVFISVKESQGFEELRDKLIEKVK